MVLELRPAHDPTKPYGFVGVVVSTADLVRLGLALASRRQRRAWRRRRSSRSPPSRRTRTQLPPALKPFGAVPPLVTDIALSIDDSALYVSCWGTGELKRFDVRDPHNPVETGSVQPRRDRRRAPHPAVRRGQRRAADGRGQPRRQARLPDELALRVLGRAVLSRGHRRLAREDRLRRGRRRVRRSTRSSSSTTTASGRTRFACRAATRRLIRTASRERHRPVADARGARRLPRPEPRDGVAVRRLAGHAAARASRGAACPAADRDRARAVDRCSWPRSCSARRR